GVAPSCVDLVGPTTGPARVVYAAKVRASAVAFAWSAAVSPDLRSYTTIAGAVSWGWNGRCWSSTVVASALPGSQAALSLRSTPGSFPASGRAIARTTNHSDSTIHLVRRPLTIAAHARSVLMASIVVPSVWIGRPTTDASVYAVARSLFRLTCSRC